jgi:N6-L-threonylcarbamoyladenine synthase
MSKFKKTTIKILAIETSADETSAAVLFGEKKSKKFQIRSNVVSSQILIHRKTGGIVPEVAARTHLPKILPVIKMALGQAKTNLKEIDYFAVTTGPGLVTSLMVGMDTARALAFALKKPIIAINHLEGHLISALGSAENSKFQIPNSKFFPALGLVVSGGHTLLVLIKDIGRYQILGETLDDAAGECFDKVAKILGLSYPGGPALARLAEKGNPQAFDFPRPMLKQKNYNFSFAGLKTAVLYFLKNNSPTPPRVDVAASVEQAIVDVLVTKTISAAKEYRVKTVLLGGGVSANTKLRATLKSQIGKNLLDTKYLIPNTFLTTDNAGMVAVTAFFHAIHNRVTAFDKVKVDPNWELASWKK